MDTVDRVLGVIATVSASIAMVFFIAAVAPSQKGYTILSCTDALNQFVVVGVSKYVVRKPSWYEIEDTEGNVQTYSPGAYESCVTLSAKTAQAKGLLK